MAKFALACEGITDQIVIENILCGFYSELDNLDEEISPLQPPYDATTQKQKEGEFGGWEMLLQYLSEKRFRDDVLNNKYVIVQIDTDISDHPNFDVLKQNNEATPEFIKRVAQRLIAQIDSKEAFYEDHKEKIIFAISVHSLECWLFPIYKPLKNEKIVGCEEALKRASKKIKVEKNYKSYDALSEPFLNHGVLMDTVSKSTSLEIFVKAFPSDANI